MSIAQNKPLDLAALLDHRDPQSILNEVLLIWKQIYPTENTDKISSAWAWTVRLYRGEVAGYAACRTEYHDLQHATDTALALMRMIHGAARFGIAVPAAIAQISIAAALLHDAGFIQNAKDVQGTGAKHTKVHVQRSQMFFQLFTTAHQRSPEELSLGCRLIDCTDLAIEPEKVDFPEAASALTARMLAAADLWAQMADRVYLEKLLFLYFELREGGINVFLDEEDLLTKTPDFYALVEQRLRVLAPVIDGFLTIHFRERWNIEGNLYRQGIERQRTYLEKIMKVATDFPSRHLRRDGIVDRVKAHFSTVL
ncbi:MAG: hypothetical protein K0A93_08985 [Desulfuromonadaceae bacterium]|nr:hypothetical protein [Desulfuromonadaceae bacterium]